MSNYNFKSLPEQFTFKIKKRVYKIHQLDLRSIQTLIRETTGTAAQVQAPEYDLAFAVLGRGTVDDYDLSKPEFFDKHFKGKVTELNQLFGMFFTASVTDEDEAEESPNE